MTNDLHMLIKDLASEAPDGKPLVSRIKKIDLTEEVIKRMKELLERGDLRAGSKLPPERELAEMLGISRPSLRQALKALSVMGIIKGRPGYGTYVTDRFSEILSEPLHFLMLFKENLPFTELFEARAIIETKLASLAASRVTEDDLKLMEQSLKGMKDNLNSPKGFLDHEIRFHKAIIDAAGNSLLSMVMDILYKLLNQYRERAILVLGNGLDAMYERHARIFEEIARNDPDAAEKAADDHFVFSESVMQEKGLVLRVHAGSHSESKLL
jgi:GntR family transcriptional repressor for pyruvate dehydrogenase complex